MFIEPIGAYVRLAFASLFARQECGQECASEVADVDLMLCSLFSACGPSAKVG